jgi:uncharacterized protein
MTPTGRADRELTAKEREPVEPADRIRVPLACQRWEVVSFLHWPYDPAAVRPLVPEPFELDLFDGSAWIGLVPFRMITRPPGLPPIPWLSTFAETNVRTYVRAPDGRRGIWFLSLDVGSASNAAVGALMGLPYRWSAMKIDGGLGERRYASRRLVPGSIVSSVRIVGSAETVRQTELDRFLTARFRLYAMGPPRAVRRAGRACSLAALPRRRDGPARRTRRRGGTADARGSSTRVSRRGRFRAGWPPVASRWIFDARFGA